ALEYCRDGGHCLQASALATAARATIGSGPHVPQLAGQAAPPMYQAATNDDPSSDPGGDPQVDEIAINHVAMDRFGQCGETCVGIQLRCQAETLSDRTLDGTASTFGDFAGSRVVSAPSGRVGTGKAHADTLQFPEAGTSRLHLLNQGERSCDALSPFCIGGKITLLCGDDLIAGVNDRDVH